MIFIHTIRRRLASILGLEAGRYTPAPDGSYLQVRLGDIYNPTTETVSHDIKKGQTVYLRPETVPSIVAKESLLLVVNPALQLYGTTQGMYLVEQRSLDQFPEIVLVARKDVSDLAGQIDWLVRIYALT